MDGEQAARWAAAQEEVPVGADLVAAALRQLEFLAAVDRRRWLYEGPLLDRAIRRYKACWLPLLAKHTNAPVVDGPLVVPLDCEWIWHCHRLNPVQYLRDCKKVYGRILNNDNVESSTGTKSKIQSEKIWKELYPEEPFELEYSSSSETTMDVNPGATDGISYDLVSAVKRQSSFYYQVGTPTMHDQRFLVEALARYKGFLYLIKMNQEKGVQRFRVPTYDVDLMWHTHQLHPASYCKDMLKLLGKVLEHDDTDADRSEGKKLDVGFTETTEQFEGTFGVRYWKAGCMYRGNTPSPVTSTPHIFNAVGVNGSDTYKVQKGLNVLNITFVELYLQIVDIKNLPSAVPKENVYVWFTKNQSDMFICDGGRLDISTVTGKTGAVLQCEPTGELILTVMVDQASKKPEPIGKFSIPLQDLTGPDSKLSFERWFELKAHGGHATSPPVSLRVAASATVPSSAQKVFRMVTTEPFSLKSCLLPHSIKDQKMGSWTRFVYDCGTEVIRLQIREHKVKKAMACNRELVGVLKSPKEQLQLAEFKENKWTLKISNLSISDSTDGSMLDCKDDNQLIKLYRGRKLEYERKCCKCHSEDDSAVTAVKFCAEYPYGKAVALLDKESKLIMVNEDGFLLPWITISFLCMEADGEDDVKFISGAMDQKVAESESDKAMVSETETLKVGSAAVVPAQCGTCSTAFDGEKVMAGCKSDHASSEACQVAVASCENGHAESAGAGAGYGGSCGPVVVEDSKADNAKSGGCGLGCGGGCSGGRVSDTLVRASTTAGEGQAKSAGCGSGCGGGCGSGMVIGGSKTSHANQAKAGGCGSGCGGGCGGGMVIEGSKTSHAKSGGCGSGCGGGCGGGSGFGTLLNSSTTADQGLTKSGGCGSGCGGGCGSGMAVEGSKTTEAKSGGCGSGCGGGFGTLFNSSTVAGEAKSGGCGSGCGSGGCGGGIMVIEGSKSSYAKSGGCGSGCGGGCGNGIIFNSSTKAGGEGGHSKSGGCASGCGGGGCGGGCGVMFNA
ncbi:hypothetical protein HU200_048977 [Digitaria exilis]|uniref:Uncharacterized protein n=1 Tax=Digitaria exilis TaxID=1010633 RepID=A0A835AUZ2_9POAL|nr:hypothetical protein HU200_048977 [Digitaria exilis]